MFKVNDAVIMTKQVLGTSNKLVLHGSVVRVDAQAETAVVNFPQQRIREEVPFSRLRAAKTIERLGRF